MFLPACEHSEQFFAFSTISLLIRGHHISAPSRIIASQPELLVSLIEVEGLIILLFCVNCRILNQ